MSENEEKLRNALREHAVRLDARYGRICCSVCGGRWVPGTPETHARANCLATLPPNPWSKFVGPGENLRKLLDAWEIPWPERDASGDRAPPERCSKIAKLSRRAQYRDHHHPFPPSPPERVVYADVEEDFLVGDGTSDPEDHGRRLSDEEWAAALATYEKAKEAHEKSGGFYREKTGPDIVDATFILENGGHANARWMGKGPWSFLDWTSDPLKDDGR